MIFENTEIKILDRIYLEFPEVKKELQKVNSNLKAAALLYCFLGDKANNVKGENSLVAKKLQNIVLLYFSNRYNFN